MLCLNAVKAAHITTGGGPVFDGFLTVGVLGITSEGVDSWLFCQLKRLFCRGDSPILLQQSLQVKRSAD